MNASSPSDRLGRAPQIPRAADAAPHHSLAYSAQPSTPTAASLVIDDLIDAVPASGRNGDSGTDTIPVIPEQANSSSNGEGLTPWIESVEMLSVPPIFDAAAFRDLRERLFDGLPPTAFPETPDPTDQVADRPTAGPDEDAGPAAEPGDLAPAVLPAAARRWGATTQRGRVAVLAWFAALIVVAAGVVAFVGSRPGADSSPLPTGSNPPGLGSEPAVPPAGTATSTVTIASDGAMTVETQIVLPPSTTSLTLSVPDPDTTRAAAPFHPQVTEIVATPDGSAPIAVADLGSGSTETVSMSPGAVSTVTVTYRVTGAVIHSEPSPPLRRAVLATPVMISAGQPVMATLGVPHATNFGCWLPGAPSPVGCGEPTLDGWQVTLPPTQANAVVIAQLDLPR